ncbi:MAG: coniferyl aldehyde dehydrogenase [Parasphingorhabdus sp.]
MEALEAAAGEVSKEEMMKLFDAQRAAFHKELPVSYETRMDRINRTAQMILDNQDALCEAVSNDFGHRSSVQTVMTDLMSVVGHAKDHKKNLKKWMRPEKRKIDFPLNLMGASGQVEYQPKGVVGVISPWNFPINLAFDPAIGAFGAGNRVIIKFSEFTPETGELCKKLVAEYFSPEELVVITGGPDTGKAFSEIPWDHLIFTGGGSIAKHVMSAAAQNLTPVTLELGGKSPTIIGPDADVQKSTQRIAMGKMMNAGQICLAPDYLMVPQDKEEAVVNGITSSAAEQYPTLISNDDYTSVINARHKERLQGLIDDAVEKGAKQTVVNPADEDFGNTNSNKMPLTVLQNVNDDMRVMQEEIFGPVLPVKTYKNLDEVVDYVNENDRPLGLYYFGETESDKRKVLDKTISGGVTVNDVIFHIAQHDLPFGGVGPSGMGAYTGPDGFKEFSHAKAIYRQPKINVAKLAGFLPPYGEGTQKTIKSQMKL